MDLGAMPNMRGFTRLQHWSGRSPALRCGRGLLQGIRGQEERVQLSHSFKRRLDSLTRGGHRREGSASFNNQPSPGPG